MTTGSLLLVEDNEDDVFFMKRALKAAGIAAPLHIINDGQQAIDYLAGADGFSDRARYPLPTVMFVDLKLPYRSGFEVLSWLREQRALDGIFVVTLTSSPEDRDRARALELGARRYLVKPPTRQMIVDLWNDLRGAELPASPGA